MRAALRALANASIVVTAASRDVQGRFAPNLVELHLPANTIAAHDSRDATSAKRSAPSSIACEGPAGAGQPGAGEPVPVVDASTRKQRPARATSTRPTAHDNQLSLLNPDPA